MSVTREEVEDWLEETDRAHVAVHEAELEASPAKKTAALAKASVLIERLRLRMNEKRLDLLVDEARACERGKAAAE